MLCDSLRNYQVVEWPIEVPFYDLTAEQAKVEFEWFVQQIPTRLRILLEAIRSDSPDAAEKFDYSPDSLTPLGAWFLRHVHLRKKSAEEIEAERLRISHPSHRLVAEIAGMFREEAFTAETISLAYDIGIYMGLVFQKQFPALRWTYKTKEWDAVHPNEPILDGVFGDLSPFHEVLRFARIVRIVPAKKEGPKTPYDLRVDRERKEGLRAVYDWQLRFVLPTCPALQNYTMSLFPFAEPRWGISFLGPTKKYKSGFMLSTLNEYIPERIKELRLAVRMEDPEAARRLSFTPESIVPLGAWLCQHIHVREAPDKETEAEKNAIKNLLAFKYEAVTPDDYALKAETLSLCFDVGIYVGEVMRKRNKNVRWAVAGMSKPYLEGFTNPRNPFDQTLAFAHQVRRGEAESGDLGQRFDTWMNELHCRVG